MKKKKIVTIFLCIVIAVITFYSLLLSRFKNYLNNIAKDLSYGYSDYCSEDFVDNIEKYINNKDSVNLFFVGPIYKNVSDSVKNNSCYKTNGLTPSVYIYTLDNSGLHLEKADGYKESIIVYIDENGNAIFDYEGNVKVRGNSTSALDKKPYTIKFSEKKNLIDAGEAKKWNLLADAYDPTLLRNNTFLTLAEQMELDYTPEHNYVEVYMDQKYIGCYLLTESIEVGKERVNIDLDNKDFFLEFESYRVEEDVYYFNTKHNIRLALKEPEEPTEEQITYYRNTINELDKVLFSNNYEELNKNFDLESFVKLYLINEYSKTNDFINSSVNFYYKDGKMYAGPVWDFDLSSGNANAFKKSKYWDTYNGERVAYMNNYCRIYNPIFKQLFTYKEVQDLYNTYLEQYSDILSNLYETNGFIDTTVNTYISIFNRNYLDDDEGGAGWDVSVLQDTLQVQPQPTYQENVDYLKEFLKNRLEWISNNK